MVHMPIKIEKAIATLTVSPYFYHRHNPEICVPISTTYHLKTKLAFL